MTDPRSAARGVLDFWFGEVGEERWFAKDEALDAAIATRFGLLRQHVFDIEARGWREPLETITAAIILLDQFSRNIFRGSAQAFVADPLALELAIEALDRGWSHTAPKKWRAFLLMPLMHSEDLAVQNRSVAEFRKLGEPLNADFAERHRDQIIRFGRFPGRNQALGRVSTAEEKEALAAGAAF